MSEFIIVVRFGTQNSGEWRVLKRGPVSGEWEVVYKGNERVARQRYASTWGNLCLVSPTGKVEDSTLGEQKGRER